MIDKDVFRTAPATPGLLIMSKSQSTNIFEVKSKVLTKSKKKVALKANFLQHLLQRRHSNQLHYKQN